MSLLERITNAYRRGGAREVLKKILANVLSPPAYQNMVGTSFATRWEIIRAQIPADAGTLFDVGSNLGDFTAAAADVGLLAIGIEKQQALTRKARVRHANNRNCAFMCTDLTIEMCRKMPCFDVVLLLSVHHHWHNEFGKAVADEMLHTFLTKSRIVIFEGPSRPIRYSRERPDFIANQESSVTSYYSKFLVEIAGRGFRVSLLGKSPCVGEAEPFRWIYAISR
jgi:SAM-dependent methyltransferase